MDEQPNYPTNVIYLKGQINYYRQELAKAVAERDALLKIAELERAQAKHELDGYLAEIKRLGDVSDGQFIEQMNLKAALSAAHGENEKLKKDLESVTKSRRHLFNIIAEVNALTGRKQEQTDTVGAVRSAIGNNQKSARHITDTEIRNTTGPAPEGKFP